MIVFPHLQKLIVTPPKCGSTTLNEFMARPPYNGYVLVGPMGKIDYDPIKGPQIEAFDHHTNLIPNGLEHYKKYAMVRHPLQRLVSLWGFFARIQTMEGKENMDVNQYLIDIGMKKHISYFFQWNLEQCLGNTEFDGFIHQESLDEDLEKFGLKNPKYDTLVPRVNVSAEIYSPLPKWEDVLRPVYIEGAKWWWDADLKYGYEVNLSI